MPELPEVQTIITTLRPLLAGKSIRRARVLRSDVIKPAGTDLVALLANRRVTEMFRRGKKIILVLDNDHRFYIHLGMTGRLTIQSPGAPLEIHTHLVLEMEDRLEVRFRDPRRFGGVWWLGTDGSVDAELGPEPLTMTAAELAAGLSRTRRAVKTALLDQSLVAGLGNIYADEALFAAGIHPLKAANTLTRSEIGVLSRSIKLVLKRALKHKGSTLRDYRDANGNPGDFQKLHRVYGRAGQTCFRCGTPIKRQVIGGRSAHFCPACQPPR
jgi:formamidopyrimidine-DNA glycosylase